MIENDILLIDLNYMHLDKLHGLFIQCISRVQLNVETIKQVSC